MSAGRSQGDAQLRDDEQPAGEGYIESLETLRAELARLKAEVEALRKAGVGQGGALPATAVVLANEALDAAHGFYPVERTEDGVAFCWTGPSPEFSFTVAVDRFAGADLRLEGINFIDFERQKDVRLSADGEAVPVKVARGGIGITITATLPARTGTEPTALAFALPVTITPAGTADTRELGLAFFRLTVTARA
jgi:hypothetical protein